MAIVLQEHIASVVVRRPLAFNMKRVRQDVSLETTSVKEMEYRIGIGVQWGGSKTMGMSSDRGCISLGSTASRSKCATS